MAIEAPAVGAGGGKVELFPTAKRGGEEDVLESGDIVADLWAF